MKRKANGLSIRIILDLKNFFNSYLKFLPSFMKASGMAFLVDSIVFTLLRPSLGTNYSALTSFFFGTITLFSILRILNLSHIKSKKIGVLVQLFIGLGSFMKRIAI